MKWIFSIICAGMLCAVPIYGQETKNEKPSINKVTGLSLPPAQTVNYDEGFVTLTAECKGTVKWLVLSTGTKIKFKVNVATPNEIDVAVPPYESTIVVFCIGVVDGKQTEFARTDIIVKGAITKENTQEKQNTAVPNAKGTFHLSIIEDPAKLTKASQLIIESVELRTKLKPKKTTVRVYDVSDPILKEKKFDVVLQKYGAPLLILQDANGKALVIGNLPEDVSGILKLISPYVGKFDN